MFTAISLFHFPAAQSVHIPLPAVSLYFPDAHAMHAVFVPGPVYPALHLQAALPVTLVDWVRHSLHAAELVPPGVGLYVLAPQGAHKLLPDEVLYFPTAHAVHGPPFGPV